MHVSVEREYPFQEACTVDRDAAVGIVSLKWSEDRCEVVPRCLSEARDIHGSIESILRNEAKLRHGLQEVQAIV
jgi:hypothetical protein